MMKLVSVNVALPKTVDIKGTPVLTAIYKLPQSEGVWLSKNGLSGDASADLTLHGGEFQAAYCYPFEHYAHWQEVLGKDDLPSGTFGENFTTSGLTEKDTYIGDVLAIGKAVVQVTMPRIPCFKFGHKVGKPDILPEFLHSGRSGFYLKVLTEGMVQHGDDIKLIERDPQSISIRAALGLQKLEEGAAESLQHALAIKSLPPLLRDVFSDRLAKTLASKKAI